jgi:hypothetical protein
MVSLKNATILSCLTILFNGAKWGQMGLNGWVAQVVEHEQVWGSEFKPQYHKKRNVVNGNIYLNN